jgi:hypothetical protein
VAAVAAPLVISAVFAQHIKPELFDGLPPINDDSLVESYRAFVPRSSKIRYLFDQPFLEAVN